MREREKLPYREWPEHLKERQRAATRRWRENNPEKYQASVEKANEARKKKYWENHDEFLEKRRAKDALKPESNREWVRKSRFLAKKKVFDHYGRICKCCGEWREEFLTMDHVNNDGGKHRRELSGGKREYGSIYLWLVRNNFPEGFQTLCYNCNCSKGRVGYCPHEKERATIVSQ